MKRSRFSSLVLSGSQLCRVRVFRLMAVALFAVVAFVGAVGSPVAAQDVARSYRAVGQLQTSMIVSLSTDKSSVSPATQKDTNTLYGIVIRPNDAPLSLSGDAGSQQQAYVATTGTYQALVSDQNGAIKEGDYISMSSIDGVGMKVSERSPYVVGKALQGYDGRNIGVSRTTVKDSAGHEQSVAVGTISLNIDIRHNPAYRSGESPIPGFLQKLANSIAGRPVSPVRIYLALGIFCVVGAIVAVMMYAGVRASIIALGRNPLARKMIFRNLIQVIIIALVVLAAGLSTVYLLLKL